MQKNIEIIECNKRNEILDICSKLYETKSFKDISIKEIAEYCPFARSSVYNYFRTKEEIFLALLQEETEFWIEDLNNLYQQNPVLEKNDFIQKFSKLLENRKKFLKLLTINLHDIEVNCRMERLVEFKVRYKESMEKVGEGIKIYFKDFSEREVQDFIFQFFPYLFGIYPYTYPSDEQKEAMIKAGLDFPKLTIHDMVEKILKTLLLCK